MSDNNVHKFSEADEEFITIHIKVCETEKIGENASYMLGVFHGIYLATQKSQFEFPSGDKEHLRVVK